jgi:hypothetical protein
VAYVLIYETATASGEQPADIDIEAREIGHPTAATRKLLLDGIRAFGRADLTALADEVAELPHDGRRAGKPPYSCGPACANNTFFAEEQVELEAEIKECFGS